MEEKKWPEKKEEKSPAKAKTHLIDKKMVLALIGLVVLWLIFVSVVPVEYSSPYAKANVSFKAIANNETILDENISVAKGTNAFEAMKKISDVDFEDYGESLGVLVQSIEGVKPRATEFWKLFVNGEEAMTGISSYTIEEDTIFKWEIASVNDYMG